MTDTDCPVCGGIVRGAIDRDALLDALRTWDDQHTETSAAVIADAYDPKSPFEDLEDENADLRMTLAAASAELTRLRGAIEDFILWWDMPPFALDDDERLRVEVDALRVALAAEADRGVAEPIVIQKPTEADLEAARLSEFMAGREWGRREAVAAWLASPDTVDVVARVPLFQRIVDDTSTLESYEEVAAALIEAIRQEMTK